VARYRVSVVVSDPSDGARIALPYSFWPTIHDALREATCSVRSFGPCVVESAETKVFADDGDVFRGDALPIIAKRLWPLS